MDPADLSYLSDDDDFDPAPAFEVFDDATPIGRVERAWIPTTTVDRRARLGWRFEHVDGRLGIGESRSVAVADALAQPSPFSVGAG